VVVPLQKLDARLTASFEEAAPGSSTRIVPALAIEIAAAD
jgi:hypothetical protein